MKLRVCASGRLRKGPELALFNKYKLRSEKIGRLINVFPIDVLEYDSSRWIRFLKGIESSKSFPSRSHKILLDERGRIFSSNAFAESLRSIRDSGITEIIFFIGAADGVPAKLRDNFDEILSLGEMVWPHFLTRVMLMEQIYRASTILAALPYHKE